MKNTCVVLAVASLTLATVPGWSQEPGVTTGTLEPNQPAAAAKGVTLQQRMRDWGKLRPVSQQAVMPAMESASPQPSAELVPPAPAGVAMAPMAPMGQPCVSGPGHRPCWEQLDEWLTYRPLNRDCCDCLPKCRPCCPPPLYTFFLGECCVNSAGPSCRGGCARDTSCGSGHRLAAVWDRMHNYPLWPGNVGHNVRQGLSGMFFYLGTTCAPGSGGAEESLVEKEN